MKYDQLVTFLNEIRAKEKKLQEFYCTINMPLEKILSTLLDAISLFQEAITVKLSVCNQALSLSRCKRSGLFSAFVCVLNF